ncbi:uncharacterized protein LOC119631867 isoform X1 [Glossina fuscipes]|uniref:Uncharacterized protein LOC119631867 isoform X1 n=1 Tax=Glossina fuscipes TaxID=7396 RepID=A0A8U0W571_9MUSC|nr:uncharacterized protein LOC119631867 isoform X1 [Glossina fuscipes]
MEITEALQTDHVDLVVQKPDKPLDKLDPKLSSPVELKRSPEKEYPDKLIGVETTDSFQPDHSDILKATSFGKLDSKLSSSVEPKKSPERELSDKATDVKSTGDLVPDRADVLKPKAFDRLDIKLSSPIKSKKSPEKEHPDKLLNLELVENLQTDCAGVLRPTSTKPLHKLDSKAPLPAEFLKTAGKEQRNEILVPNVTNVLPIDYSDHHKTEPINKLEPRVSPPVELKESTEKESLRDHLPIEVEDFSLPELNKFKDQSISKSKPHIDKNFDKIILKDSGAIAYFVGLEQTVDRTERSKRPETVCPQIESKFSAIILGTGKKPTNLKTINSNKTPRKLPAKRTQDSSKTTTVEKPHIVSEVENKKPSRKSTPKQDERNPTKLVALNNQIRLERISRTKTQPTTQSAKTDSTFTRTKPRQRTEITSLPQNQTLRTFSPPSTHPKPDYSGVTSIYAHLRKSQKKSASIKSKESTTVSRSSTPNEESQSKRTRTPTPSKMYNYMRPTMAHNLRYGVSKTSEDEISVEEKLPRSPVPTKRSDLEKSGPKRKKLTKLGSNISGSKTSLSKSLHQVQDKDITTVKSPEVKPKKKAFGPVKSGSEKRSVQHLKEHKLQRSEQSVYDRRLLQKRQNTERAEKIATKKAGKDEKVKFDEMTSTKKQISLVSSKVSIGRATETGFFQTQKRDKVQEIKKFESKSRSQDKHSTTKKVIDKEKLSDDVKVQKKLKNTINQSNATSSTSFSVRKSKSKTTARSAASKKIEKEIANQRLTEKKPLTTTTTRISTIKLYREPVLTTLVSTVIIDDGDSENTTRSTRSNDSTKSSSSTGSKKIITSEVFTKTFGPDKPFEVIYRQPEVDYMSMMRPQSVEQRCVNEFDVSFIDTTDSSLSDSVALPIFGSDQDRLHAASPGSPKPTRSPLALIEETVRKQQMDGFALDPTLQRQFEAVGMINAIESPTSELILKPQETLDEYLPESHSKTTKQADDKDDKILDRKDDTKYKDGEKHEKEMDDEDDDDDDEDDEEDYERDKSVIDAEISVMKLASDKDENVRFQAKILVDRVLEDSIHVVDEQRDQDDVDNNKHDYNSESENYAITCDDINGLEVIKSPTIESMSGKSFDDNMSFTDEHLTVATTTNTTHVSITTTVTTATSAISSLATQLQQQPSDSEVITGVNKITEKVASEQICMSEGSDEREEDETDIIIKTRTRRIDHKFQKLSGGQEQDIDMGAAQFDEQFGAIVQDDEISNLQGEFSKLSWDDSVSPTTNTLGDIGQNTPDNDIQDIAPEIGGDLIKSTVITPVPPSATISSSSTDIIGSSIQDTPTPKPRLMKRTSPSAEDIKKFVEIETADGGSIPKCISEIPVPKPRSQMKSTESYKNLAALQVDSDSPTDISLTKRNATETVMEGTTSSDDSVKKSEIFESSGSKTSFYIGESSQNIIIKTTSPKSLLDLDDNAKSVLNEIPQKNAEDINKEKKDSIEFKSADPDYMSKITRQSSETRNDLLEQDVIVSSDKKFEPTEFDLTIKDAKDEDENEKKEKIVLEKIAPQNVTQSQLENGLNKEIFEPKGVELEKRCELELPLEKDDWEINAKEIPPPSKNKIVYSPQQPTEKIVKPPFTEEIVTQTLDEVQESIEAAKRGLKSVLKDAKLIKESPSEFEFRTLAQSLTTTKQPHLEDGNLSQMESEDISSFIGIPEPVSNVVDNLNKKAVAAHYTETITDEKKLESGDEYASLGFVSTGTYDSDPQISREDYASLGFVSTETVEDFSSMEDYYQENIAKAHETIEPEEKKETIEIDSAMIESADDEKPVISIDAVIHRTKSDESETGVNRWSVPEIDLSSSSESYYRSLEKSPSRPLSSDVDNLMTQANSSDYQTAIDASGTYRESTEFASAVSRFDSSSEKTISSHESMRSLDSHSETSAYLGSIDVSELSETLVASSMEEADEIARLQDLADEEDSEESLDLEMSDYAAREGNVQQSMMKRSQEMIFKLKADDGAAEEIVPFKGTIETVQIEEYPKAKEVEKSWDFVYPKEEQRLEEGKESDDMIVSKFASSLDEGSVLSVSMSSASNIDTVVENFEDMIGSVGASSVASIEGFMFPSDEHASSSLPEDTTFVIELDNVNDQSPQDTTNVTPPDELRTKRGHKRGESASINDDLLKNVGDKEILPSEGKESESESDTDPYETEYSRQFRSPIDRKSKKKKHTGVDVELSFVETEKRPFTPSQLIAEVIVEDAVTEELEAEECFSETRRPSQNMQDYSNIPDITVTQDTPKLPDLDNFSSKFQEKSLYKVKTQEELHRASDDRPLYNEKSTDSEEENFKKMVQQQYQKKLAELQKAQIGDSDYDDHKTPDSPDSFEMVDKPDISDEFVIIEEVAKEANEDEMGGKSIRIKPAKYEYQHDEEVEKIIIKSAPADPKLGSQILRDDLNFEFEESPPTASSGGAGSEPQEDADPNADAALGSRRWVEMQLVDNQLRYPYELTGGVLEDIKEEDAEFEVGSSRISSFKDSFSSTPDYDVLAARRHYSRGDHDDISMSSLQEFESLEQAISLENRNRTHQGSTDSSNGSFTRRYMVRHGNASGVAHGDDISISSLKEFEGLENACIEAHLIEIKAKEEAALLSRSDESNKSNGSDRDPTEVNNVAIAKAIGNLTQSGAINDSKLDIGILLKQKLEECEKRAADYVQSTEATSERREIKPDSTSIKQHSTEEREHSVNISPTTVAAATDSDITSSRIVSTTTTTTILGSSNLPLAADTLSRDQMTKDTSMDSLNLSAVDQTTSSAGTTATYQTSAGNSQMSGSVTSCASSTLMEESAITTTSSWSSEEKTVIERLDNTTDIQQAKH